MNENDPAEVFRADQEEAISRDQQAWTMNMETMAADLAMKDSHTRHTNARATFWFALAAFVTATTVAAWVAIVVALVWVVFG